MDPEEKEGQAEISIFSSLPKLETEKIAYYKDLISKGECETVEFKSTMRFDMKTKSANKDLIKAVAKSLCGFMNTMGGYLFIGVSDSSQILGIEDDLSLLSKNEKDVFLSAFHELITVYIGKEYSRYIHAELNEIKDKQVCCVRIEPSERPVWFGDAGNETFFLRVGNSTRPLNAREANDYIMNRFTQR